MLTLPIIYSSENSSAGAFLTFIPHSGDSLTDGLLYKHGTEGRTAVFTSLLFLCCYSIVVTPLSTSALHCYYILQLQKGAEMLNKSYCNLCETGVHLRDEQRFPGNLFQRNSDLLKIKTTIKFLRKVYLKHTFQKSSKFPLLLIL